MKVNEVNLKVEIPQSCYAAGESIHGTAEIITTLPVMFETAELTWLTQSRKIYEDADDRETLNRKVQPISELSHQTLEGRKVIPLDWDIPKDLPVTIEMTSQDRMSVSTILVVTLHLGEPYGTSIIKEYPIKIISPRRISGESDGGILQSVEFPLNGCWTRGKGVAHIEMMRTVFTAGDCMEATIVVDLHESNLPVYGASMALKRIIFTREKGSTEGAIDERELHKGQLTNSISAGQRTVVTASTTIPRERFIPDVESDTISVSHFAMFIFNCPRGYEVETEVPIHLVHPESRRKKSIKQ